MTDANVMLWGRRIGAVTWDADRSVGIFQYDPDFIHAGVQVSPIVLPVRETPYLFPALNPQTFKGLPGLVCDSLPDTFGNALIDVWLADEGLPRDYFNPVDRLCYVGNRGIGALEFSPAIRNEWRGEVKVSQLTDIINRVFDDRSSLIGRLTGKDDRDALDSVLSVGTSAGGARAKAVLAWNPETGQFRSGQIDAPAGFEHWLLKFDGVSGDRDREMADPHGYGLIEYAYYLMAQQVGIQMSECRLHHEANRSHFMTRRFDRDIDGRKIHMQSLGALRHFDFNQSGSYAYEQVMQTIRELGLKMSVIEQQFRRAVFNIVGRNQDDHVKNIAFLMDQSGQWSLSPAYDMVYAYNPSGLWTRDHQMSIVGKRNNFEIQDLLQFAESSGLKKSTARGIIAEIVSVVTDWPLFAKQADIDRKTIARIGQTLRTQMK